MVKEKPREPSANKVRDLVGAFVKWRAITHRGLKKLQNEDAHWVSHSVEIKNENESTSRYIFAIADGFDGYRGGAIASRIALKSVKDCVHRWHGGEPDRLVGRILRLANRKVFCVAHSDSELFQTMQTTLTVVALDQDSLTVGHVGDCRLYRLRDGCIELLTRDHTKADDLLKLQGISAELVSQRPGGHKLTRTVGSDLSVNADIVREKMLPGDTYLLCSDGLWSEMTREEIQITMQENTVSSVCEKLARFALRGGAPDNLTAIVFRVETIGTKASRHFSWRRFLKRR